MEELRRENDVLKTDITQLRTDNATMKNETKQLRTDNATIKDENELLKIENDIIKAENVQLKARHINTSRSLHPPRAPVPPKVIEHKLKVRDHISSSHNCPCFIMNHIQGSKKLQKLGGGKYIKLQEHVCMCGEN